MALTDPIKAISINANDTNLLDGRPVASSPQSSWISYGIMIGKVPTNPETTVVANVAAQSQAEISWNLPNIDVQPEMFIEGAGIPSNTKVSTVDSSTTATLDKNLETGGIADGAVLTFTYGTLNTIKVKTIDNLDVTIEEPVQDQLLPLQVAQVYATGTANVRSITAYQNQS